MRKTLLTLLAVSLLSVAGMTLVHAEDDDYQRAVPVKTPPPDYPANLRKAGVEGVVDVQLKISARGTVVEASVRNTNADPRLAKLALEAVKRWKFRPAKTDNQPVESTLVVPITFSLED